MHSMLTACSSACDSRFQACIKWCEELEAVAPWGVGAGARGGGVEGKYARLHASTLPCQVPAHLHLL